MRGRILMVVLFSFAASSVHAQDPVKVDSQHYGLVTQNKQVRVLRVTYGPHEKSVMHWHPNAVAVFLTDGRFKFTMADGSSQERDGKAGDALWTPAEKHLPENLGDQEARLILVELKQPKRAATAVAKKKY